MACFTRSPACEVGRDVGLAGGRTSQPRRRRPLWVISARARRLSLTAYSRSQVSRSPRARVGQARTTPVSSSGWLAEAKAALERRDARVVARTGSARLQGSSSSRAWRRSVSRRRPLEDASPSRSGEAAWNATARPLIPAAVNDGVILAIALPLPVEPLHTSSEWPRRSQVRHRISRSRHTGARPRRSAPDDVVTRATESRSSGSQAICGRYALGSTKPGQDRARVDTRPPSGVACRDGMTPSLTPRLP